MLNSLKSRVDEAKGLILQKRSISVDEGELVSPKPIQSFLKRKSTMNQVSLRNVRLTGLEMMSLP